MKLLAIVIIALVVTSTLGVPAGKKNTGGKKGGNGANGRRRSPSPGVHIVKDTSPSHGEVVDISSSSSGSESDSSSSSASVIGHGHNCCDEHCLTIGCDCDPPDSSRCRRQQAKLLKKLRNKGDDAKPNRNNNNNNKKRRGGGSGGVAAGKLKRPRRGVEEE